MVRNKAERETAYQELENQLDECVGEEDMDVERIKEIVKKMDEVQPQTEPDFDKKAVWSKIQAEFENEFAGEFIPEIKKERITRKLFTPKKKSFAIPAAAVLLVGVLFVGGTIGTQAWERNRVIQHVESTENGERYWAIGDSLEMSQEVSGQEVYYSWNELPKEYKSSIIIPKDVPEELSLYYIKKDVDSVSEMLYVSYRDGSAQRYLDITVDIYKNDEFVIGSSGVGDDFKLTEEMELGNITVKLYKDVDNYLVATFNDGFCKYVYSSNMEDESFKRMLEKTLELR